MKKLKTLLICLLSMLALCILPLSACDKEDGGTADGSDTEQQNPVEKEPEDKEPEDKEPEDKEPDDKEPDDTEPEDPQSVWSGSWKTLDETLSIAFTKDGATVTDGGEAAEATSSGTDSALTLTAGEKSYELTWYSGAVANKIMVLTDGDGAHYLIPAAAPEIDPSFNGTWYDLLSTNILTIDTQIGSASFNGTAALAVVDCGYQTSVENNDGSTADINHNCLYLIMEDGGDVYFIGWYQDSTTAGQANGREFDNPTVDTPADCETPLTHRSFVELYVDEDLNGTWRNVAENIAIVIDSTAGTVKVNGTDAEVYNNGGTRGAGNIIIAGGTAYRLEPDPGYNYYLTRETVIDLGMGVRDYFLRSDHDFLKIENENLQGTEWADLSKTHKLSFDAEGNLKYDNVAYTVFVAELLDNLSYKVIAFSADNKKVELSYTASTDSLNVSDGFTENAFYKGTAGGETQTGFLGLPIGTIANAEGREVVVTEDSLIIKVETFDYYDDEDITVTQEMLLEADPVYGSSKHYTFQWTDVNKKVWNMHIALDVTASWAGGSFGLMISFSENEEHFFLNK